MKYIFVTGGVVSSLGKGPDGRGLGTLLENRGLKVVAAEVRSVPERGPGHDESVSSTAKCMCWTTARKPTSTWAITSGSPTCKLTRLNNLTSGQVYQTVLNNEREGKYLGKTVQVIPHVTDEIQNRIHVLGRAEQGGRAHHRDRRHDRRHRGIAVSRGHPRIRARSRATATSLFIHVTYVPFIKAAGELKTKPTQQSVAKLREIGIAPHILVCRCEKPLDKELRQKISPVLQRALRGGDRGEGRGPFDLRSAADAATRARG